MRKEYVSIIYISMIRVGGGRTGVRGEDGIRRRREGERERDRKRDFPRLFVCLSEQGKQY